MQSSQARLKLSEKLDTTGKDKLAVQQAALAAAAKRYELLRKEKEEKYHANTKQFEQKREEIIERKEVRCRSTTDALTSRPPAPCPRACAPLAARATPDPRLSPPPPHLPTHK